MGHVGRGEEFRSVAFLDAFPEQSARAEAGLHCGLVLGRVIRCQLAKRRLEAARCRQRHRLRRRRDGCEDCSGRCAGQQFRLAFHEYLLFMDLRRSCAVGLQDGSRPEDASSA